MNTSQIRARYDALSAGERGMNVGEWDSFSDGVERDCVPLREFMETWGPYCGAPREVFRGHLMRLLLKLAGPCSGLDNEAQHGGES